MPTTALWAKNRRTHPQQIGLLAAIASRRRGLVKGLRYVKIIASLKSCNVSARYTRSNSEMAKPLDLDAYLKRINYTGPRTPTYDALTGILQAHIGSIPFESFDVLLGRPIRLDPE
jgi:N-acetyltransferase